MIDDLLSQVQKPGRYIGNEWNLAKKDFEKSRVKFALCFPDLYEVGMSNLGIRILYGILNSIEGVVCERFFACDTDMEMLLRQNNRRFFSLESKRTLAEFDIVGFSLGFELGYTNVLNILDLGGIPLISQLRDNTHPLIIAGGPCTLNPEPMHEFFDLFFLGEAEEAVLEIVEAYAGHKEKLRSGKISRQDLLLMLSRIEGVYVPSLYEVSYNGDGKIQEFRPKVEGAALKISKRVVKDFDNAFFPCKWLVPYIETVHDRISLELMRGCPNSCRFCQARSQYFPYRVRSPQNLLAAACAAYQASGYEDISLGGLSVSDYPYIEELLNKMVGFFKPKAVSVSLPSIKPTMAVGGLSGVISTIKKTGLTFAPEAATGRLREILGKDFCFTDFLRALQQAYSFGYQHVKLYFMIGLPWEEDKDLDAIADFARQVSELRRRTGKGPAFVNISINALIPKPHTCFQWLGMSDPDSIKRKQGYLKDRIKSKRFKLNFHNRYMSFLEGVLSRGDRRLSRAIFNAFDSGARFDAWEARFNFSHWAEAFNKTGIDPNVYLQERSVQDLLPWEFMDVGISKESLLAEFQKAIAMK